MEQAWVLYDWAWMSSEGEQGGVGGMKDGWAVRGNGVQALQSKPW